MLCSWSFFALCEIWFKRFCFAASVAVTTEKLSRQDSFFRHDPPRNRSSRLTSPASVSSTLQVPPAFASLQGFCIGYQNMPTDGTNGRQKQRHFHGLQQQGDKVLDKAKIQANQLQSRAVTDVELLDSLQWITSCYSTICKSTFERFGDAYHCHRRPSSPPWCRPSQ